VTAKEIRHAVVVAKTDDPDAARLAAEIVRWIRTRGADADLDDRTALTLPGKTGLSLDALPASIDLAVVVGGDGTLLSVARRVARLRFPLLGVNRGSLGFLTELQPEELFEHLGSVLAGDYRAERRQTLRVRHMQDDSVLQEFVLLNDAVVTKSALARMIHISLSADGEEVAVYTSDGLIVSTPTGSTAYSLSAGGPVLDPRMAGFVITPICPHTMTYRPLVVPASVKLKVGLRAPFEAVYVTLDGQIGFPLGATDTLAIDAHPDPVRLVRVTGRGFFEVLRRKLRWGERTPLES
jgi:NAD+ kinase